MQHPSSIQTLPELYELLRIAGDPTLVLFTAEWSGASCMMKPVFESIRREMKPRLRYLWLDLEKHSLLAGDLHVLEVPTVLLFENGALRGRFTGMLPKNQLIRQIGYWLRLAPDHPPTLLGRTIA